MPTQLTTTVTAEPDTDLVVGDHRFSSEELNRLAGLPYPEIKSQLAECPKWSLYAIGVVVVLMRHGHIAAPQVRLRVTSDVPQSVGLSSSAALEVATARALVGATIDSLELASLCQEAENHIVGAPCGIMDQVAVAMGWPGMVLPILCRPASVMASRALPPGLEIVGVPTGADHDVGGASYRQARVAAFMGKKMVEQSAGRTWDWVSDLPRQEVSALPEAIEGASFLDRWGDIDDAATSVDPTSSYPVRAATSFGVDEHARANLVLTKLERGDFAGLGAIMAASHGGYDAMGLGHPAATEAVEDVLSRPGVIGARSSGGGCGGTVVAACHQGALDGVEGLIR
jgi:L-arabinokinase